MFSAARGRSYEAGASRATVSGMEGALLVVVVSLLPLFFLIWIALQLRQANAVLREIADKLDRET